MEGKILRNIEICRKCPSFHVENDPWEGKPGWHWGVGVRCSCVAFGVPWKAGSDWSNSNGPHAVSEEEFVRVGIRFADPSHCPQNRKVQ